MRARLARAYGTKSAAKWGFLESPTQSIHARLVLKLAGAGGQNIAELGGGALGGMFNRGVTRGMIRKNEEKISPEIGVGLACRRIVFGCVGSGTTTPCIPTMTRKPVWNSRRRCQADMGACYNPAAWVMRIQGTDRNTAESRWVLESRMSNIEHGLQ